MSTRTTLRPYYVITAGSMAGNLTSLVTTVNSPSIMGYQVYWSGTSPVGTLSVQMSWDYQLTPDGKNVETAGTWTTLTLNSSGVPTTTLSVSGNTGSIIIDPIQTGNTGAIRLIYTAASGTGNLTALVSGKVS